MPFHKRANSPRGKGKLTFTEFPATTQTRTQGSVFSSAFLLVDLVAHVREVAGIVGLSDRSVSPSWCLMAASCALLGMRRTVAM